MRADILKYPDFYFTVSNVYTTNFPISSSLLKSDKGRLFFVSATDGRTTKETVLVKYEDHSLRWNDTLDGFCVKDSSSQFTLKVYEKHRLRPDELLATFILPHNMLCSSQKNFLIQSADDTSKKKKTPSRELCFALSDRFDALSHAKLEVEKAREGKERLQSPSARITDTVDTVNKFGKGFDLSDKVVTSAIDFCKKRKDVLDRVAFVMNAVDSIAELHPYAKLAWSVISFIPMVFQLYSQCAQFLNDDDRQKFSEQIDLDQAVVDLLDAMDQALNLAQDGETLRLRCGRSDNHKKTLKCLIDLITECGYFIQSYLKDVNFWKRFMKNVLSNGNITVENYRESLKNLRDDFVSEAIVNVESNVFRIIEKVEDHDLDMKLRELPYGISTRFNPEKGCLPQTRVKFLNEIINWVNDLNPQSPRVLVLVGQAGTGKSSIAHEVAHRFHRVDRLTTSYCFVRGQPSSQECYRFFTTLACDLCHKYPSFRTLLGKIINNNRDVVHARDFTTLFEMLLRNPLQDACPTSPIFIVIDALDENEDSPNNGLHAGSNSLPFHSFLGQHLSEFPPNFRILITSRPEPDIMKALPPSSFVRHMQIHDEALANEVDDDLLTYVRTKLQDTDIDEGSLHMLAKRAEHLFQWASVACFYIAKPPRGLNSKSCLQRVLHPTVSKKAVHPLDALYMTVLERFDMDDNDIADNFRSVMGQILGAYEPLPIVGLNMLHQSGTVEDVDFQSTAVSDIVKEMGSLLSNVSPPRKPKWKFYIDLDKAHGQLAYATLRIMEKMLHFNICKLETSYRLNSDIPDLNKRIESCIPSALSYSCRFWSEHHAHVSQLDVKLLENIRMLLKEKFLYWLEVLSLRAELAIATKALLGLETWLGQMQSNNNGIDSLGDLVKDAFSFVRYFGYPMAQSAPHIYLSTLPFVPSSSLIAKHYLPRFPYILDVKQGRLTQWPALVMTISVPGRERVVCVAWSWDDEYVASCLFGGTIFVWNASTGTMVRGPLITGGRVTSVAFSCDGLCLASGLSDGSIRIWELATGQEVAVTLKDPVHKKAVSALSFSQDGKRLISGSADHTVLIWNFKGEVVAGPFDRHKNPVWAVAFLRDQEHVVSRSGFRTVQVWNVKTGQRVIDPFEEMEVSSGTIDSTGHYRNWSFYDVFRGKSSFTPCSWTEAVACEELEYRPQDDLMPTAAFSRDGKFVATSSRSHIHVWYANGRAAGELAGGPFSNDSVMCLALSADGQRIASGSVYGTVHMWNVKIVDEVASRSTKQGQPCTVVFTPDDKQVLVGQKDGTVRAWDASNGHEAGKIKEGDQENKWLDLAISQNGNLFASVWKDQLHIWTRTGETVAGAFKSSDEYISCVAFSPDVNEIVAFGTKGGTVSVFDALIGAQIAGPKQICTSAVESLALSHSTTDDATPTTRTRVAVGTISEVYLWDTYSGDLTGPVNHHQAVVNTLLFSVDAREITSVASDYTLCVWDSITGDIVRGPIGLSDDQKAYATDSSWFTQVALTQKGQRVAFIGDHHTILVFEVRYSGTSEVSLQGPLILGGHTGYLNRFAFSKNGQFLATPSDDHTIRIWDLRAAVEHKQTLIDFVSDDSGLPNVNEAFIDNDGWVVCRSKRHGPLLRLIWLPEVHRSSLHLSVSASVVVVSGHEKETLLDLESFVHGRGWVKCKV